MRVLMSGGAGFIGATTAAALLDTGHEMMALDDLSTGHHDAVSHGATFVKADVTDPAPVSPIIADSRFDACIHFAALIEAGESMVRPGLFFAVNTAGTLRLLEVLLTHGVDRFVLSSTAAVYGEPERTSIDEDDPLAPTNASGESKLLVERAGGVEVAHRAPDLLGWRPRRDDVNHIVADAWAESPPGTDAGAREP